MWFIGSVLISCGFIVIKYNNAWWCKIKIWTSVGGADSDATPPQKGVTRTLIVHCAIFVFVILLLVF